MKNQPFTRREFLRSAAVAGAAVSNAAAEEETKGEELFIWTPQELCCRFCGRATVYLDCG